MPSSSPDELPENPGSSPGPLSPENPMSPENPIAQPALSEPEFSGSSSGRAFRPLRPESRGITATPGRPAAGSVSSSLVLLLVLMVGLLLIQRTGLGRRVSRLLLGQPMAIPREIVPRGNLADDEQNTIAIFQKASLSVVNVASVQRVRDRRTLNPVEIPQGTGSGFVWDSDGHVVTNFHVIQGGNNVQVTLADQSTWPAKVVGVAPDQDLAVLRIDAPRDLLSPIPIGSSHDLQRGQKVFAIGSPFGLDQTLTTGIISGLGRQIPAVSGQTIEGVIQTDAAINPGNSGGPLLDSAGRLIGINTAIYSPSGGSAGIGFAVPVDMINEIIPVAIRDGQVERGFLGVELAPDDVAKRLGVSQGVLIYNVINRGAADAAGIEPGDVVLEVDGVKVAKSNDLFKVLTRKKAGQTVELKIVREEKTLSITVKLQAMPQPALR